MAKKNKAKTNFKIPSAVLEQIKNHNFTKELKDLEYETKFDISARNSNCLDFLKKLEASFTNSKRFLLCKIRGGDKLVTKVIFFSKGNTEYSFFKYRGARMIKIKKHKVIRTRKFPIFKNIERMQIDRDDFKNKLQKSKHRFKRHSYTLVDLEKALSRLKQDKQTKQIGEMVKTRVKDFVLDAGDGRIYAVAVTFCFSRGKTQRQLEIEYAGFISGFKNFKRNSERRIISGVQDLSEQFYKFLPEDLTPSTERKFEFVKSAKIK